MDNAERNFYQIVGESTLFAITQLAVSTLCVAIFTPLYAIVVYTLIQRKEKSLYSKATLVIVSFSLFTSLGNLVLRLLSQIMVIACDLPLRFTCPASYNGIIINGMMMAMSTFPLIFNDSVIIWRAWFIFGKHRWASVLTIGLCISSFVVALLYVYPFGQMDWTEGGSGGTGMPEDNFFKLNYVFFGFSVLTNAVATLFIGWVLLKHLRFLRNNGLSKHTLSRPLHILVLLLDSGVMYFFLQMIMFGLQFCHNKSDFEVQHFVYLIFASLYLNISYVYPSLTILLAQKASSIQEFHHSVVSLQTSQEHSA